jgi:hypothetical protein
MKRPRSNCWCCKWGAKQEVCDNGSFIDAVEDMLPIILSYLKLKEIMCTRRVSKTWTAAVSKTAVSPEEEFDVDSVMNYEALGVMSTVLPNLQSVGIKNFCPSTTYTTMARIQMKR